MLCSLSHPTLGTIRFSKLSDFSPSEPEKRISTSSTLDGESVHQVSKAVHTARVLNVPMVLNKTDADTLKTMNRDTSNFIFWLQTGDEVFKGFFRADFIGNPVPDFFRYRLDFYVTEKLDA